MNRARHRQAAREVKICLTEKSASELTRASLGFRDFQAARPEGFEPSTYRLEVCCSIQLSYGRGLAGGALVPKDQAMTASQRVAYSRTRSSDGNHTGVDTLFKARVRRLSLTSRLGDRTSRFRGGSRDNKMGGGAFRFDGCSFHAQPQAPAKGIFQNGASRRLRLGVERGIQRPHDLRRER